MNSENFKAISLLLITVAAGIFGGIFGGLIFGSALDLIFGTGETAAAVWSNL